MTADKESVRAALAGMDFPGSKADIVAFIEHRHTAEDVRRAIRALPVGTYDNASQVAAATPRNKATEEDQSDSDKALQQRHNTDSGLAEHQTQRPRHPIVDELGENRGS